MLTYEQVFERIKTVIATLNETIEDETLRNDMSGIHHYCAACMARNSLTDLASELDGTERVRRELTDAKELIDRSALDADTKLRFVRGHICDALVYAGDGRTE